MFRDWKEELFMTLAKVDTASIKRYRAYIAEGRLTADCILDNRRQGCPYGLLALAQHPTHSHKTIRFNARKMIATARRNYNRESGLSPLEELASGDEAAMCFATGELLTSIDWFLEVRRDEYSPTRRTA
jgi:hypothetical protein